MSTSITLNSEKLQDNELCLILLRILLEIIDPTIFDDLLEYLNKGIPYLPTSREDEYFEIEGGLVSPYGKNFILNYLFGTFAVGDIYNSIQIQEKVRMNESSFNDIVLFINYIVNKTLYLSGYDDVHYNILQSDPHELAYLLNINPKNLLKVLKEEQVLNKFNDDTKLYYYFIDFNAVAILSNEDIVKKVVYCFVLTFEYLYNNFSRKLQGGNLNEIRNSIGSFFFPSKQDENINSTSLVNSTLNSTNSTNSTNAIQIGEEKVSISEIFNKRKHELYEEALETEPVKISENLKSTNYVNIVKDVVVPPAFAYIKQLTGSDLNDIVKFQYNSILSNILPSILSTVGSNPELFTSLNPITQFAILTTCGSLLNISFNKIGSAFKGKEGAPIFDLRSDKQKAEDISNIVKQIAELKNLVANQNVIIENQNLKIEEQNITITELRKLVEANISSDIPKTIKNIEEQNVGFKRKRNRNQNEANNKRRKLGGGSIVCNLTSYFLTLIILTFSYLILDILLYIGALFYLQKYYPSEIVWSVVYNDIWKRYIEPALIQFINSSFFGYSAILIFQISIIVKNCLEIFATTSFVQILLPDVQLSYETKAIFELSKYLVASLTLKVIDPNNIKLTISRIISFFVNVVIYIFNKIKDGTYFTISLINKVNEPIYKACESNDFVNVVIKKQIINEIKNFVMKPFLKNSKSLVAEKAITSTDKQSEKMIKDAAEEVLETLKEAKSKSKSMSKNIIQTTKTTKSKTNIK